MAELSTWAPLRFCFFKAGPALLRPGATAVLPLFTELALSNTFRRIVRHQYYYNKKIWWSERNLITSD